MAIVKNQVKFYKECYKSDHKGYSLLNFFKNSSSHHIFIEKEELLNEEHPKIPINAKKAEEFIKHKKLNENEKEIIYGSSFICGKTKDKISKKIAAPIFYYSAEIIKEQDFYYLYIDLESKKINTEIFTLFKSNYDTPDFQSTYKKFSNSGLNITDIRCAHEYFSSANNIDADGLYDFPKLVNKRTFNKVLKESATDSFKGLSMGVIALVKKSNETKGTLSELDELSQKNIFSSPIQELFKSSTSNLKNENKDLLPMPIQLSEAQEKLVKSSINNTLTLIYGPPGTGKTYTIGAIALQHILNNKSVLIVSKTNTAVDVVYNKTKKLLDLELGVVRGGKSRTHLTNFRRIVKSLMTRVYIIGYMVRSLQIEEKITNKYKLNESLDHFNKKLKKHHKELTKLEKLFEREIEREVKWGKNLTITNPKFWDKFKKKFIAYLNFLQDPIWISFDKIIGHSGAFERNAQKAFKLNYIKNAASTLESDFESFQNFYEVLKTSNHDEKISLFRHINIKHILNVFPIWCVSLSEIKDILPFHKELFDTVIIDEATQCDIASVLPSLYRAKKAVFAGDPNQLRHLSFVSYIEQKKLASKFDLNDISPVYKDYRNNSILDIAIHAVKDFDQISMLDEHYRSQADIIRFSNQSFYENELRIMTSKPESSQSLFLEKVMGKRTSRGYNIKESNWILKRITKKIQEEEKIPAEQATTIGILSPFRDQVEYIRSQIEEKLSIETIEKHKISIGTAYDFQGDEKDEMHISFCLDMDAHHSSYIHINKPEVFNVAITRAKNKQYIYYSVDPKKLKSSLLKEFLQQNPTVKKQKSKHRDQFLDEVIEFLKNKGVEDFWISFYVSGIEIDILIRYESRLTAIDLIGFPGVMEDSFGLSRYKILERAAIKTIPLPFSNWHFNPDETKIELMKLIRKKRD